MNFEAFDAIRVHSDAYALYIGIPLAIACLGLFMWRDLVKLFHKFTKTAVVHRIVGSSLVFCGSALTSARSKTNCSNRSVNASSSYRLHRACSVTGLLNHRPLHWFFSTLTFLGSIFLLATFEIFHTVLAGLRVLGAKLKTVQWRALSLCAVTVYLAARVHLLPKQHIHIIFSYLMFNWD